MVVMDDGWFGKRDDDNSGLGDWQANEKKLGCTLKELTDKVNHPPRKPWASDSGHRAPLSDNPSHGPGK